MTVMVIPRPLISQWLHLVILLYLLPLIIVDHWLTLDNLRLLVLVLVLVVLLSGRGRVP